MSTLTIPKADPASDHPLLDGEALYEIVGGQRVELPPMSIYATLIGSRLSFRMGPFAEIG